VGVNSLEARLGPAAAGGGDEANSREVRLSTNESLSLEFLFVVDVENWGAEPVKVGGAPPENEALRCCCCCSWATSSPELRREEGFSVAIEILGEGGFIS